MRIRSHLAVVAGIALCLMQGAQAIGACGGGIGTRDLPAYSLHYDPVRDPLADAQAAFALAAKTGRRVLIEVGGDWCRWCHVLDRLLAREPELADRLHCAFVVLKLAIDEDHDAAAVLGVYPTPDGYPYLYAVRADGALLHAQDAVGFLDNGDYSAPRVAAFVDRWSETHE